MCRYKDILLILLTVIGVGVGALLPRSMSAIQEQRLEDSSETRELDDVQLLIRQELSAAQILNLFSGPYTKVTWNSGTDLSEKDAMDAAFESALIMIKDGLIPASAVDPSFNSGEWLLSEWGGTAEPFLVISNDDNQISLLLWQCIWESPGDAVYTAWIDDTTKLMCGFSRTMVGDAPLVGVVDLGSQLALWYGFLAKNYGIWMQDVHETDYDVSRVTFTLSSAGTVEGQQPCTVRLRFEGENFFFVI